MLYCGIWNGVQKKYIKNIATYSPQADFLLKFLLSLKNNMDVQLKEKWTLGWEHNQKLSSLKMDGNHLTDYCIAHRGAVCIHVAELWDGVLGVDGDDDLRPGLVPVKPTWNHFLTLPERFQINNF